jgi:mRNA-degrading endonuclease YafQ of YafQ-DinJ toxin-antitoxin module
LDKVDLTKIEKIISNPKKIPSVIVDNLQIWAEQIETFGLIVVQKVPRWKDHKLLGKRKHQRAVSLSYQWRAIYEVEKNDTINIVHIEEVTPHDY